MAANDTKAAIDPPVEEKTAEAPEIAVEGASSVSISGGRYEVNGRLVNANGDPINADGTVIKE